MNDIPGKVLYILASQFRSNQLVQPHRLEPEIHLEAFKTQIKTRSLVIFTGVDGILYWHDVPDEQFELVTPDAKNWNQWYIGRVIHSCNFKIGIDREDVLKSLEVL